MLTTPGLFLLPVRLAPRLTSPAIRMTRSSHVVAIACRPDLPIGTGLSAMIDFVMPRLRPGSAHREGHGIVGMRERAALVGGSVTVGRSPSGGWRVDAHLPVAPVPAAADVVA